MKTTFGAIFRGCFLCSIYGHCTTEICDTKNRTCFSQLKAADTCQKVNTKAERMDAFRLLRGSMYTENVNEVGIDTLLQLNTDLSETTSFKEYTAKRC